MNLQPNWIQDWIQREKCTMLWLEGMQLLNIRSWKTWWAMKRVRIASDMVWWRLEVSSVHRPSTESNVTTCWFKNVPIWFYGIWDTSQKQQMLQRMAMTKNVEKRNRRQMIRRYPPTVQSCWIISGKIKTMHLQVSDGTKLHSCNKRL